MAKDRIICLFVLLAMAIVTHAAPANPADPAEILRDLADGKKSWQTTFSFEAQPELLLDAIFLPKSSDFASKSADLIARSWIAKLADAEFRVREEASAHLAQLGPDAIPALKNALHDDDPEICFRAYVALKQLEVRPMLADLDYNGVRSSIDAIAAGIRDDAVIESILRSSLRRIGPPTVHGRECWLIRPFFKELVKRKTPHAVEITTAALESRNPELLENVGISIEEATILIGPNLVYVAALGSRDLTVINPLLRHAPMIKDDSKFYKSMLQALQALMSWNELPELEGLRVHRLLLVSYYSEESLTALIGAAFDDHDHSDIVTSALLDPRLSGIRLGQPEVIGKLLDHPSAEVRAAAGSFLLTRPDEASQRIGVKFIPQLDATSTRAIGQIFSGMQASPFLRAQLQELTDSRKEGWRNAENLLIALPRDLSLAAPYLNPMKFR